MRRNHECPIRSAAVGSAYASAALMRAKVGLRHRDYGWPHLCDVGGVGAWPVTLVDQHMIERLLSAVRETVHAHRLRASGRWS